MIQVSFALVVITLLATTVFAQTSQNPCGADKLKEFDFWVGAWDLEWKGPKGEVQKGTNEIKRILDGCVVEESFNGGRDLPLRGRSYSMVDRVSGKWKQTWVDNQGSYLDFTGALEDGKMVLSRAFTDAKGNSRMQRMVFFNIRKDSLEWNWENSTDGGKTWNLAWHIDYKRRSE